jgi:hypothetical protein
VSDTRWVAASVPNAPPAPVGLVCFTDVVFIRLSPRKLSALDSSLITAGGAIAGGLFGEAVVDWIRTTCTTVAVAYQRCQPHAPAGLSHVAIDAVCVICGGVLARLVYRAVRLP